MKTPDCSRRVPFLEALESRIAPALIYGVDSNNHLLVFDSAKTKTLLMDEAITGLGAGESIIGVDFRPATGNLYAITRDAGGDGRLYLISTSGNASASQIGSAFGVTITGSHFDMDFNPMVDRIRVVSDSGMNFRVNPDSAAFVDSDANGGNGLTPDGNLAYAAGDTNEGQTPGVTGLAYTNSSQGALTTDLFAVDTALDTLAGLLVPNNGQLTSASKPLGPNSDYAAGFDILAGDSFGYAALHIGTKTNLYTIDLATGKARSLGTINDGGNLVSFSVALGHLGTSAPGTLTYRDLDGDTVTVKSSRGTLLGHTTFGVANGLGGMQLQTLVLIDSDFAGASISIKAKASSDLGNGFVNVGRINADGTDLKALTVRGDLASLLAGNTSEPAPSIGKLSVNSIGRFGVSTQEAGGTVVYVLNDGATSVSIATIIDQALLTFGDVKTFKAGGFVNDSTLNFDSLGALSFGGLANNLAINAGSINKLTASDFLTSSVHTGTSLGSISIGGDVFGSSFSAESFGPIKIGGSVLLSNFVASHGNIGAVSVAHDWFASSLVANIDAGLDGQYGTADDSATTPVGDPFSKIASITIKGQLSGTPTPLFYGIEANTIGRVSIGGRTISHADPYDALLGPTQNIRLREFSTP